MTSETEATAHVSDQTANVVVSKRVLLLSREWRNDQNIQFFKLQEYEEVLISNSWSLGKKITTLFFFKLTLQRKGWRESAKALDISSFFSF